MFVILFIGSGTQTSERDQALLKLCQR